MTIVLHKVRLNSIPLTGPDASDILYPVPVTDIRKAIKESLPGLIESLTRDERNVVLTLARMWYTAVTNEITTKDIASQWAMERLPMKESNLVGIARMAYLGECKDHWEGRNVKLTALVLHMKQLIEVNLR